MISIISVLLVISIIAVSCGCTGRGCSGRSSSTASEVTAETTEAPSVAVAAETTGFVQDASTTTAAVTQGPTVESIPQSEPSGDGYGYSGSGEISYTDSGFSNNTAGNPSSNNGHGQPASSETSGEIQLQPEEPTDGNEYVIDTSVVPPPVLEENSGSGDPSGYELPFVPAN